MDDRLHAALAAIDPAAAAHCAARWPRMDAAERGAVEHLVREHSDAAEGEIRGAGAPAQDVVPLRRPPAGRRGVAPHLLSGVSGRSQSARAGLGGAHRPPRIIRAAICAASLARCASRHARSASGDRGGADAYSRSLAACRAMASRCSTARRW